MDIFTTVLGFCDTVSQTDTQYKLLSRRLTYELQKAQHLLKTQKVKTVPKFMLDNLKTKIKEAKQHLQKIQSLLKEDQLSLKQKIKLSLPFNKTNKRVNASVESLEKAQQDVLQYSSNSSDSENNGKRTIDDYRKRSKKQDTMVSIMPHEEVDDEDIDEALMGPTVQEDAAIEFTRNKYVVVEIQICGEPTIIKLIKEIDPNFLIYSRKVQIKFDNAEKKEIEELQLFSLGRLHFKPVYGKLRTIWADVDRISKQSHFVIKLKRKRENVKTKVASNIEMEEKQEINNIEAKGSGCQQFFSFPATDEIFVKKETDIIVVERAQDKSIFINDETGFWSKMNEIERELCQGDEIAPWIGPNRNPQVPDLYFKVHFNILE